MPKESPLGKNTVYVETYSPELLFPIPRTFARDKIGIDSGNIPFMGVDIWTGYEISWLNLKGKPEIAMGEFFFPCTSPNVVESKSFKLYLNSFNQSQFESIKHVQETIRKDLSIAIESNIDLHLFPLLHSDQPRLKEFSGICLDSLDIETDVYEVNKEFLGTTPVFVEETLYTNLLKSNCLATGQPDWGSVQIQYSGPKIDHKGLLKYFISFRRHAGFAEHCVEQFYYDIMNKCSPEHLSVYGRYTRRGGLDINPFRSNFENNPKNIRQIRQ
jgi:7-cyano-7-deazaguanine reductase